MKKYYYITNGSNETEMYQILTSKEDSSDASVINVSNEFGNGAGWSYEIYSSSLAKISKEEYETLANYIGNWSVENEKKFLETAGQLVHGKYHMYSGEPWRNEKGWWHDVMVPQCLESVDVLIEGLQKWKNDAMVYYKKKDNEHAEKVAAGYNSNMIYSKGPAIEGLISTFIKLGYIDINKLPKEFQDYHKEI